MCNCIKQIEEQLPGRLSEIEKPNSREKFYWARLENKIVTALQTSSKTRLRVRPMSVFTVSREGGGISVVEVPHNYCAFCGEKIYN